MTDDGDAAAARHLTIAIVSNQCLLRHGLHKVLEQMKSFRIQVRTHLKITPDVLLAQTPPDLFILDLDTEQNVLLTIQHIQASASTSKIILLSGLAHSGRLLEAFTCGIEGVILKEQPPEVVRTVIEAIYAPVPSSIPLKQVGMGGTGLGGSSPQELQSQPQPGRWPEILTQREREIIPLVEMGLSNKEIADRLSISLSTVRHHLTSIFDKVGVHNRQKLLVHARHVRTPP